MSNPCYTINAAGMPLRKIPYPSERQARRGLDRLARCTGVSKKDLNAYKCPVCHEWHVGHKPRSRKGAGR